MIEKYCINSEEYDTTKSKLYRILIWKCFEQKEITIWNNLVDGLLLFVFFF